MAAGNASEPRWSRQTRAVLPFFAAIRIGIAYTTQRGIGRDARTALVQVPQMRGGLRRPNLQRRPPDLHGPGPPGAVKRPERSKTAV